MSIKNAAEWLRGPNEKGRINRQLEDVTAMKWHDKRVNIADSRGSLPWKPRKLGKPIDRGDATTNKAESYPRLQFRYTKRWHLWSNELLCGDVTIIRKTGWLDARAFDNPPLCLVVCVIKSPRRSHLACYYRKISSPPYARRLIIGIPTWKSITYRKVLPLCFRWSRDVEWRVKLLNDVADVANGYGR